MTLSLADLALRNPILPAITGSQRYQLYVNPRGTLSLRGPVSEAAWTRSRLKLVSTDRTVSRELRVNASGSVPVLSWRALNVGDGQHEDLYLFDARGQEWTLQLKPNSAGSIVPTLTRLSYEWDRLPTPVLDHPGGGLPAIVAVSAAGEVQVSTGFNEARRQQCRLLSLDGTVAWDIRVTDADVVQVVELARTERRILLRGNATTNVWEVIINDSDLSNPLVQVTGPISGATPTAPIPSILATNWSPPTLCQMNVNDADVSNPLLQVTTTGQDAEPANAPYGVADHAIYLRSTTSGVRYVLTVAGTGTPVDVANPVLTLSDDDLAVASPTQYASFYDAELTNANGQRYQLHVDQNGLLYLESITALYEAGDEWPVLWQDNKDRLICVDQYTARLVRK